MLARSLLSVFVLLLLGCDLSTEPQQEQDPSLDRSTGTAVEFRADHSQYEHGDTARIVLRNGSNRAVGYNLCFSSRDFRTAGTWKRFEPLRICTAALYSLAPGAETILREPITAEWQPGEYRMVTTIDLLDTRTRTEIFTPPFTVRR